MPDNAYQVSRVIALEEHAWTPSLRAALVKFGGDDTVTTFSNQLRTSELLLEVGEQRLARMDAAGVDFQVLSITAPGVQQLPVALAVPLAREANDFLPMRFNASRIASPPLQRLLLRHLGRQHRNSTVASMSAAFSEPCCSRVPARTCWITSVFGPYSKLLRTSRCRSTSTRACRPKTCAGLLTVASVRSQT